MYSKAKFLGHPIHPMLVAFPVAFYTATAIAYVAFAVTLQPFWFRVGIVANIGGVIGAAAAAIPGFIDWSMGIPSGHPAKTTGLEHMLLNVGALGLFGLDAFLQYRHWTDAAPSVILAVALAAVGMALTLAAGFLGWKMVQTHHVGVDMTVEQERIDVVAGANPARIIQSLR